MKGNDADMATYQYVYQKKAAERIRKNLTSISNLINRQIELKIGEADTRRIVVKVLSSMLGWDQFDHLTGEYAIKGGYADYVIRKDQQPLAVVEVKPVTLKTLKEQHIRQARDYAINEGIDWVILTTGNEWQVYKIVFEDKVPDTKFLFSCVLNDKDMKPAKKTELLYHLSEEAFRKNELEDYYQRNLILQPKSLAGYILTKGVIDRIRCDIRAQTGKKIENAEIAEIIAESVLCPDAMPDDTEAAIRRVNAKPRAARKVQEEPPAEPQDGPEQTE